MSFRYINLLGGLAAMIAITGCETRNSNETPTISRVDAFVAAQTSPSLDERVSTLINFARTTDAMLNSRMAVRAHAGLLLKQQTCFSMTYGIRAREKQEEMLRALADTPERQDRWRAYIMITSSMPSVSPTEDACAY